MFGISLTTWLAIACVLIGLGIAFRASLSKFFGSTWERLTKSKTTKQKPDREQGLAGFNVAYAYLEAEKCEAGMKALLDSLPHFYHPHEQHP